MTEGRSGRSRVLLGKQFELADKELKNPTRDQILGKTKNDACTGKCCIITTLVILGIIGVAVALGVVLPQVIPKQTNEVRDTRCDMNTCQNNSTCVPEGESYRCACTPAYEGKNCTIYLPCWNNPCEGEGYCTPVGIDYICSCGTKFKDSQCFSQNISVTTSLVKLSESMIAGGFEDNTVRIWTGIGADPSRKILPLVHTDFVRSIAKLNDGRLVTGSCDTTILIWDNSYNNQKTLKSHTDCVNGLVPLSDMYLVSGSKDMTIIIWNLTNYQVQHLKNISSQVNALIYNSKENLKLLACGSSDSFVRVYDFKNKNLNSNLEFPIETNLTGHSESVLSLAFIYNPRLNGDFLASGSADKAIIIWNTSYPFAIVKTLIGHEGAVTVLASLYSGYLASGSNDTKIKIWDNYFYNQYTLSEHLSTVTALVSVSETYFVSGSTDTSMFVWQNKTDLTHKMTIMHKYSVQDATQLKLTDDLVTCSDDDSINVWDAESKYLNFQNLTGHLDYVYAVDLLEDNYIVSASKDVSVRIWDPINYKIVQTLYSHKKPVISVVAIYNHVSYSFASGSCDSKIKIWNKDYSVAETLSGHVDCINALAIYNDIYLISGGNDKKIIVRNLNSLNEPNSVKTLNMIHTAQVNAIAVLQNKDLATGSSDNTIQIWKSIYENLTISGPFDFIIKLDVSKYLSSLNNTLMTNDKTTYTVIMNNSLNFSISSMINFNSKAVVALENGAIYYCDSKLALEPIQNYNESKAIIYFTGSNDYLASVNTDNHVFIFDKNMDIKSIITNLGGKYTSMIFIKRITKTYLVVATDKISIEVYNENFQIIYNLNSTQLKINSLVNTMTVLANGNLAVGCQDGSISIYDPNSLEQIYYLKEKTEIISLFVLPSLDYLVSVPFNGDIKFWDPITFDIKDNISNSGNIKRFYFYNDELISVLSESKALKIWRKTPYSLTPSKSLKPAHTDAVLDLAVLNNGFLASSSKDRTIKIWDNNLINIVTVQSGANNKYAHRKAVLALKVLRNNDLVSTSEDRTAKIWATDLFYKIKDLQ